MRKPSQWKHTEKNPTRTYVGKYSRSLGDERIFELSSALKNGKIHTISFESHEAAKRVGWKKIK